MTQYSVGDLESEGAVTFELGFGAPLIGRGFVRKRRVRRGITDDSHCLGPVYGRLYVKNDSIFAVVFFAVGRFVFDNADRVVRNSPLLVGILIRRTVLHQLQIVEMNADPEIDVNLADGIAKISEFEAGIAAGVDNNDKSTSPPHHLIQAEIFEMAAVGEIDVGSVVGGQAKRLLDHRLDGE